jgi:DNA (cytosine-5)-methyltransferase 1
MSFKFIDLFAGLGGMRIAFENCGGTCVFSSDINKSARCIYKDNFNELPFGDITLMPPENMPNYDILLGGFPCQPFSTRGNQKGFKDPESGNLFFTVLNILKITQPKAFLLENVKGLLTIEKGAIFKEIYNSLESVGYTVFHKVLNSKHYTPQKRERVIIVGLRNDLPNKDFQYPIPPPDIYVLQDILETLDENLSARYTMPESRWYSNIERNAKRKLEGKPLFPHVIASLTGQTHTLIRSYKNNPTTILIAQENKLPRYLTPRECARLQGFPESYKITVSDATAYKLFGNSVTVPLIQAVAENLIKFI